MLWSSTRKIKPLHAQKVREGLGISACMLLKSPLRVSLTESQTAPSSLWFLQGHRASSFTCLLMGQVFQVVRQSLASPRLLCNGKPALSTQGNS